MTQTMNAFDIPGAGLAIVQDGRIVYTRGYGVRDVTTRRPVDVNTQFAIGSVSKSFTALGIMQLVDRGLVKLDTPVIHYLPEFRMADPVSTRTVTVRNLLTHTTGLARDDTGFFDPNYSVAQQIKDVVKTPIIGKPGKVFAYSNINAVLAGAIITRVTGLPWETYTRTHILTPLGMNKANFTQAAMRRTGDFAVPHTDAPLTGVSRTPFYVLGGRAAAGAINASTAEMAQYLRYQTGNGAPLLTPGSFQAMHAPFIKTDTGALGPGLVASAQQLAQMKKVKLSPAPLSDAGYAFFFSTERFQSAPVFEHGGVTYGFNANLSVLPSKRSGLVLLVNTEHADGFIEAVRWHVLQSLLGTQPPMTQTPVTQTPVNTSAVLDTYLRLLGEDPATRRATFQQAHTYRATAAELNPVLGRFANPMGGTTRVTRIGTRLLRLRASMQGITYNVTLSPLGHNRFVANDQPLIGGVFTFTQQGKKQLFSLEGPLGNVAIGQRSSQ